MLLVVLCWCGLDLNTSWRSKTVWWMSGSQCPAKLNAGEPQLVLPSTLIGCQWTDHPSISSFRLMGWWSLSQLCQGEDGSLTHWKSSQQTNPAQSRKWERLVRTHAGIIVRRLHSGGPESDSTVLPRSDSAKHRTAVPSQLDCDRQIVPPRQLPSFYLLFPNTFSGLLSTGWIRGITPKGLGNVPPGMPAYGMTGVTGETCVCSSVDL